jgi:MFS family permease
MLTLLGFPLFLVVALLCVNQLSSLMFLRIWGRLTDRLSNKSVLAVAGPLLMFCFLGWTFTTLPGPHLLTFPLLTAIHALMGLSTAGVSLASGNIALKLAPKGSGVTYLAANSVMNSVAAGIAPILAGALADFLMGHEFAWTLSWTSPAGGVAVQILNFRHFDFVFVLAFLIGLYSIHRLTMVKEVGEVEERAVLKALVTEVRLATRQLAFLDGVRNLFHIPFLSHHHEPEAAHSREQREA